MPPAPRVPCTLPISAWVLTLLDLKSLSTPYTMPRGASAAQLQPASQIIRGDGGLQPLLMLKHLLAQAGARHAQCDALTVGPASRKPGLDSTSIGARLQLHTLVEATPISQPALMCTPQWVDLAMALPTVLVTPISRAPFALAYSRACHAQTAT